MCLAVVAIGAHPRYPLVLAANRDEFHARPASPAAWWPEGWLAGRDLAAGGTWLGVTRRGRHALLTNVRDPARHDPAAPSRGALVTAMLASSERPRDAIDALLANRAHYNGFNLIVGDASEVAWGSNRAACTESLAPGIHGLSNALLDVRWPKVVRLRDAVARWAERSETSLDPLFDALADRARAPDDALPSTGVSLDWERALSAPFIVMDGYGTRCSTVVAFDADGCVRFVERSFAADGAPAGVVDERFTIER